jgi:hypothetical protein
MASRRYLEVALGGALVFGGLMASSTSASPIKRIAPVEACYAAPSHPHNACSSQIPQPQPAVTFWTQNASIQRGSRLVVVGTQLRSPTFAFACLGRRSYTTGTGKQLTLDNTIDIRGKAVRLDRHGRFSYHGGTVEPGETINGPTVDFSGEFTSTNTARVTVTVHHSGCGSQHHYTMRLAAKVL